MSLPVPVGTSVSVRVISVMECLTAGTILMNETVVSKQLRLALYINKISKSISKTIFISHMNEWCNFD